MSIPARARHSGFDDVVGNAAMERLASGYGFIEGPVWHPYEKWLVFSDIPQSRIYRRFASGEIEFFREPSHKANGNTL
ncbi:SMP-30/gluconolactonase/LRE family protein, partial [Mesorhizobium sp. M4B.F.Ca.ET.200.01.1.1]